jgi:formylglycine-generating enzyme required for sulfatase activity
MNVGWEDAKTYAAWISKRTNRSYRLLTEAEWEYMARAGVATPFATGRGITTDEANFDGRQTREGSPEGLYRERTLVVGTFRPNAWGINDTHGNVWEWVEDCWADSYAGAPQDGSARTSGQCNYRVVRGGSWGSTPRFIRSASRNGDLIENRSSNLGFRVARTIGP